MPYVTNVTPFQALGIEHRFYNGHPYDCILVKATFRLCSDGLLRPLVRQPGFVLNDEHEAGEDDSALRYASELIPFKPGTDIIIVGNAKPPGGGPRAQWLAQIQVGPIDKVIRLTGPRHWHHRRLNRWDLTDIEPCAAVHLSYGLAFGGTAREPRDERDFCQHNPFGLGFVAANEIDKSRNYDAPRILPRDVETPEWGCAVDAVGFSPVDGRQFARLQFAGTYDDKWKQEVSPNIPLDMKMEFWNVVPQDQVANPYLRGGETVRTAGLFPAPDGMQIFDLPQYLVRAVPIKGNARLDGVGLDLDTVLIDLDKRHVVLRWATLFSQSAGFDEYEILALRARRPPGTPGPATGS